MFGRLSRLKPEEVESFIGICGYATKVSGIGGVIKSRPEDFLTWEVLVDGLDARRIYESYTSRLEGLGDYVLAVMRKRGIDTIRASTAIARGLHLKPSMVSICGIKDKMSISWQFIALPKNSISGEGLRLGDLIHVLPIKDFPRPLSSKFLSKNVFEITIRKIHGNVADVKLCLGELKSRGLPNFYGHQRFGVTRPITPIIGKLMMLGKLEEAVKVFLMDFSPLESEDNKKARERLSRDFDLKSALEYFPRSLRYEREVLKYLIAHEGDYVGAMRALPLRLRRLMVESVSALIFNKALSKILSSGKLNELEIGDFVVKVDVFGRPEPGRPIIVKDGNLGQVERLKNLGKLVIALPVPGYLSEIPKSSKGEALLDAMEELEVSLDMFRLRALPEASTRGSLRPIIVPKWSCEIVHSDEQSLTLRVTLPPGCYATILLREIMKPGTPLAFVGKMNNNDRV